jgi:hypothetical protein
MPQVPDSMVVSDYLHRTGYNQNQVTGRSTHPLGDGLPQAARGGLSEGKPLPGGYASVNRSLARTKSTAAKI